MALVLQWPYREARDGIWGTQTATLDWCEQNYDITPYIAEFFNTTTNLIFMYLGALGIRDCLRYEAGKVYLLAFTGYIIVGLGSMAFHASLKYSMQLADELPMIYTTCVMAYATFAYRGSTSTRILVGLGLVALATWITAYYLTSMDPVFHQVAYGALTCALVFRNMYVMEAHLRPALERRTGSKAHSDQIMKQMWHFSLTGIALFLVGFMIWVFDNTFCDFLRATRESILLPWAALLEAHGWWHVFTGLGAYYWVIWRMWLGRCLDGEEADFMLNWPSVITSVPRIVPRPRQGVKAKANGNGNSNGYANGFGNGLHGSSKKAL
ncbi:alkaline ceramidase ydc1 [Gnomoniopsis smithogilvyi]|uniref:Alkaline ceramidase ydc1 n=1 Tax=Gnomoniopsis smithogilvyi TaxID=1191159 RepID=A0A9W9D074_9PEZI|nr:alkaline ceramidase ydc1 [Gnomoniopsis smithogilvyi]